MIFYFFFLQPVWTRGTTTADVIIVLRQTWGGKNVNLPIKPVWNSHMQDVKDENLKWMKNETLRIEGSSVSESWEKLLTGLFSAER